jgi:hypothetical protein
LPRKTRAPAALRAAALKLRTEVSSWEVTATMGVQVRERSWLPVATDGRDGTDEDHLEDASPLPGRQRSSGTTSSAKRKAPSVDGMSTNRQNRCSTPRSTSGRIMSATSSGVPTKA